jgi:hypothetical protein
VPRHTDKVGMIVEYMKKREKKPRVNPETTE